MRACIFTCYIPLQYDEKKQKIQGTGQWSDEIKGKFHQWGSDVVELAESAHTVTIAIVEEVETGKIYTTPPEHVQFVVKSGLMKDVIEYLASDK